MFTRCVFLLLAAALAPLPVFAQAEAEDPSHWSGSVSFGYLGTSGNTENTNLNSSFEVAYTTDRWNHVLDAYAISATEDESTTAEAYGAGWKSEWNLSGQNFLFGRLNYRNDRFSGFPTQFSQSAGYGRRIFATQNHVLSAEIGAGARQSERADGVNEDDLILSGGVNYKWVISETADFSQDFTIESGKQNTYLEYESSLRARLIGKLALVASFTVKYNSNVPIGAEETDTYTALSFEYGF